MEVERERQEEEDEQEQIESDLPDEPLPYSIETEGKYMAMNVGVKESMSINVR